MSDTLREAENLLKTIVSSSARLSSLRGKAEPAAEPSADDTEPEEAIANTPEIQDFTADLNTDSAANIEPEPEPSTELPQESWGPDIDMDPLPIELPETPPMDASEDPPIDDQSFSFLDLIPSDSTGSEAIDPESNEEPLNVPPPVRAKPSMPLPLGLAAGAPSSPVSHKAPDARPEPPIPAAPVRQDTPPYTLSTPRAVTPQILDPERERLEVEVYENEESEYDRPELPLADAPRLTESTSSQGSRAATTPVVPREHPDEAIFDALTRAKEFIGRGDLSEATVQLSDVLDWEPGHFEARLARGRCSRDMGDPIAAMSDFEKAIQIAPFSPEAHVEMGDVFFVRKDYGRAIQHYTDALDRDPNHPMALCRRGMCHHYRQQPERAVDDLTSARSVAPDIPNIDRYIRMVSTPQHH